MELELALKARSASQCELCTSAESLSVHLVPPKSGDAPEVCAYLCAPCQGQLSDLSTVDVNHWRCLNDSMWSEVPAVQVLAWRMLHHLRAEGWPQALLDMLYLEAETLAWAELGLVSAGEGAPSHVVHRDANGAALYQGDAVVLIKDLPVKGGGFTAKRGTVVRKISLVLHNDQHIEGRVNGQEIVILTQFVKKQAK